MKRIKLFTMVFTALIINSAVMFAQKDEFKPFKQGERVTRLSEDQRNSLKAVHEKYSTGIKDFKMQIAEAEAHQKTLMGKANPDEKAVLKNVEKISELKAEMSKKMLAMKLESKEIVAPDGTMMHSCFARRGHMGFQGRTTESCFQGKAGQQGRPSAGNMRQGRGQQGCNMAMQRNRPGGSDAKGMAMNKRRAGSQRPMEAKRQRPVMNKRFVPKSGDQSTRFARNQKGNSPHRANVQTMFTDEQKASMKELRMKNVQVLNDLRNELNELQVHQRSIMMQDEVSLKDANKNIDKMTSIKTEIAKIQAKTRLEMQGMLTAEQKAQLGAMKSFKHRIRN